MNSNAYMKFLMPFGMTPINPEASTSSRDVTMSDAGTRSRQSRNSPWSELLRTDDNVKWYGAYTAVTMNGSVRFAVGDLVRIGDHTVRINDIASHTNGAFFAIRANVVMTADRVSMGKKPNIPGMEETGYVVTNWVFVFDKQTIARCNKLDVSIPPTEDMLRAEFVNPSTGSIPIEQLYVNYASVDQRCAGAWLLSWSHQMEAKEFLHLPELERTSSRRSDAHHSTAPKPRAQQTGVPSEIATTGGTTKVDERAPQRSRHTVDATNGTHSMPAPPATSGRAGEENVPEVHTGTTSEPTIATPTRKRSQPSVETGAVGTVADDKTNPTHTTRHPTTACVGVTVYQPPQKRRMNTSGAPTSTTKVASSGTKKHDGDVRMDNSAVIGVSAVVDKSSGEAGTPSTSELETIQRAIAKAKDELERVEADIKASTMMRHDLSAKNTAVGDEIAKKRAALAEMDAKLTGGKEMLEKLNQRSGNADSGKRAVRFAPNVTVDSLVDDAEAAVTSAEETRNEACVFLESMGETAKTFAAFVDNTRRAIDTADAEFRAALQRTWKGLLSKGSDNGDGTEETLTTEIKKLKDKCESYRTQYSKMKESYKKEIADMTTVRDDLLARLSEQAATDKSDDSRDKVSAIKKKYRARNKALNEKLREVNEELCNAQEKATSIEEKLRLTQDAMENVEKELHAAQKRAKTAEERLRLMRVEMESVATELRVARDELRVANERTVAVSDKQLGDTTPVCAVVEPQKVCDIAVKIRENLDASECTDTVERLIRAINTTDNISTISRALSAMTNSTFALMQAFKKK